MSHLFHTIDRRIAKFTVRRSKNSRGVSFLKNIRLDPLALSVSNSNGNSTSNLSEPVPCEIPCELTSSKTENKHVDKEQTVERWRSVLSKVLDSLTYEGRWFCFLLWKIALKRGVKLICNARKSKIQACTCISKNFKMLKARRQFTAFKLNLSQITVKFREFSARIQAAKRKKAGLFLCLIAKIRFAVKYKAAETIQRHFRGFRDRKAYRPLILKALRTRNHRNLLLRQAQAVQERKKRTAAVRVIENAFQNFQQKKKLKEYRKYLWTLPYECRILYLKFKQVKRDADSLKADVESMIAKKEEEKLRENN